MIYKPPQNIALRDRSLLTIFLGGSIEMGEAIDWQKEFCDGMHAHDKSINIFNPRRDEWDSSWEQSVSNAQFYQQVDWELSAMNQADWIIINLIPGTQSPISLLELGIHANSEKLLVVCPEGFWRKGNVDIVCIKHDIRQFNSMEEVVDFIKPQLPAEVKTIKGFHNCGAK